MIWPPTLTLFSAILLATTPITTVAQDRPILSCIASFVWDKQGGTYQDISDTARTLRLISDGQKYGARSLLYENPSEKKMISVSRERGTTDILLTRKIPGMVTVYVTSEHGELITVTRKAPQDKGDTRKADADAEHAFQTEKSFWIQTIRTDHPASGCR